MKPLQAIALLEILGRGGGFPDISAAEVSLICSSHNGEETHTTAVKSLLKKFDINPSALVCGEHWSLDQETLVEQAKNLRKPNSIHNNCGGKHAGMLILAKIIT